VFRSDPFSRRRVLITGHTGFKDSWLARQLAGRGRVTGLALDPPTDPNAFVSAAAIAPVIDRDVGEGRMPRRHRRVRIGGTMSRAVGHHLGTR
jgi:nucleoside-diphosphate-sugar epimerase